MKKRLLLLISTSTLIAGAAWATPSVRCWGNNGEGQNKVPANLNLRSAVTQPVLVHTSRNKTCALDKSGKVTCWGILSADVPRLQALEGVTDFTTNIAGSCATNANGLQCFSALGDGMFEQPPTLTQPQSVLVGGSFACALDSKGVSCWGDDTNYNTGIETIPTLKNPKKLVVGLENACAVDDTGIVCWGGQDYGITSIPALSNPTDVFMGLQYACARDDKGIECWGTNSGASPPSIPIVPAPSEATTFVSGQWHVCGLNSKGVQCWGDNTFQQLRVPALSHPSAIFADALGNQTCAIDGTHLICWGEDNFGQSSLPAVDSLSTGESNTCVATQGQFSCWGKNSALMSALPALTDAYQVVIGSDYACGLDLKTQQQSACWGDTSMDSSNIFSLPATDYTTYQNLYLTNPSVITTGFHHACAASSNGTVCWGNNDFGQTKLPSNFSYSGLPNGLSAGGYHTCGIDQTQGLLCWGKNQYGQTTVPPTLKNPRQVSAGFGHTCALDDNGVTCWGRSSEGQIAVPPLKNPRFVQAGGYHTCALDDNGVHCWGENSFGQSTVPSDLSSMSMPKAISTLSVGLFNTCVVTQ